MAFNTHGWLWLGLVEVGIVTAVVLIVQWRDADVDSQNGCIALWLWIIPMINSILSILIVTMIPGAPIGSESIEGATVFHCDFGESWDKDFDGEPDGWIRRKGRGFPEYVSAKISEETAVSGKRCLRVEMDGGGAVSYSPAVRVGPLYSYVLEGYISTEQVKYAQAYLSLTLLGESDRERLPQRLESYDSEKSGETDGWVKVRLGPIAPRDSKVRSAIIGLHVEPGVRADLKGVARFDEIRLVRIPRISLTANSRHHLFMDPAGIEIQCKASGFTEKGKPVLFQLENALGKLVAQTEKPMETRIGTGSYALSEDTESEEEPCLIGTAAWTPPVPGPGFYRVWATMDGVDGMVHRRDLTLAVIEPQSSSQGSEFGWSLPRGDDPLPLRELSQVVSQAGVGWAKYPLWFGDIGEERVQQLVLFAERLTIHGIELVGLLSDPPETLRANYGDVDPLWAAEIFNAAPKSWYPSLETVMMRMAAQVRWWQLGRDTDTSFVDYPQLSQKILQIKAELDRIGYDVNLGFGWGWINELPKDVKADGPWQFLALSANPPLTHRELPVYLKQTEAIGSRRWMVLEPLGREQYTRDARVLDLVRRMMAAKISQVEGVFIPEPFDAQRGLMQEDGTPGDLFLPWRTTALMLGGSEYVGNVRLPGESENRIFSRGDETIMVVWNDTPSKEAIFMGDNAQQVDLWGRRTTPPREQSRQVFEVGPMPTFITGVDREIVCCRQSFSFEKDQIPSVFERRHQNLFRMTNTFNRGVSVVAELHVDEAWNIVPQRVTFRMDPGQSVEYPFQLHLPQSHTAGRHQVRIDLEIEGERKRKFSVYRHIEIGSGDVYATFVTVLNDRGELEIEQRFVNESKRRVSFRCSLFVPGRRMRKTDIVGLAYNRDVQTYLFPNGKDLIGQTVNFVFKEVDGPCRLHYNFVVKP